MKKTYIKPKALVCKINTELVIAGSEDIKSNNGINYGGVDEEGTKDPEVKQNHYNVWDDDWSK